jgi:hypothetical protein
MASLEQRKGLSVSGYGIEKRDFFWKNVVGNAGSIERE